VQLGTARKHDEGLGIGTVRRPPRGVRKEDYSKLDYFDVSMSWALTAPFTPKRWSLFEHRGSAVIAPLYDSSFLEHSADLA
jgi:uncharacterized protein YeaO (DUF488 family)